MIEPLSTGERPGRAERQLTTVGDISGGDDGGQAHEGGVLQEQFELLGGEGPGDEEALGDIDAEVGQ